MSRMTSIVLTCVLTLGAWGAFARQAQAQYTTPYYPGYTLNNMYYYPYVFFPHNYWPMYSPRWPEPVGQPYMAPPAYMAYPPFREANWRHEMWQSQRYYRGNHFWLDQF